MKKFIVLPLATVVAEKIRSAMKDDFGHELNYSTPGIALCRYCLGDGHAPMRHILFSHMPFEKNQNPYPEIGPVYIHDTREQYRHVNIFPPDLKLRKYLQARGYDANQNLIAGDLSEGENVEAMLDKMFDNSEIEYIHIRDGMTGCYFLRIERV